MERRVEPVVVVTGRRAIIVAPGHNVPNWIDLFGAAGLRGAYRWSRGCSNSLREQDSAMAPPDLWQYTWDEIASHAALQRAMRALAKKWGVRLPITRVQAKYAFEWLAQCGGMPAQKAKTGYEGPALFIVNLRREKPPTLQSRPLWGLEVT
jgi:hypothetical protein